MTEVAFEQRADDSQHLYVTGYHFSRRSDRHHWCHGGLSEHGEHVSDRLAKLIGSFCKQRNKLMPVYRSPRLSAEELATADNEETLSGLENKAFQLIERGRPANIKLGRIFNKIKARLQQGEWMPYFAKTFAPKGISLRTASDYMRLAREEDKTERLADSANFLPAIDPKAQEILEATDAAKAKVAAITGTEPVDATKERHHRKRKRRPRLDGVYRLPLYMPGMQKDATDLLLQSKKWAKVEKRIVKLLHSQLGKYGFLSTAEGGKP